MTDLTPGQKEWLSWKRTEKKPSWNPPWGIDPKIRTKTTSEDVSLVGRMGDEAFEKHISDHLPKGYHVVTRRTATMPFGGGADQDTNANFDYSNIEDAHIVELDHPREGELHFAHGLKSGAVVRWAKPTYTLDLSGAKPNSPGWGDSTGRGAAVSHPSLTTGGKNKYAKNYSFIP